MVLGLSRSIFLMGRIIRFAITEDISADIPVNIVRNSMISRKIMSPVAMSDISAAATAVMIADAADHISMLAKIFLLNQSSPALYPTPLTVLMMLSYSPSFARRVRI